MGTCSPIASNEKDLARDFEVPLIAAVGPPGFYADANPWVFGFHINSDEYTLAAVRNLYFWSISQKEESNRPMKLPIRVIYRTQSQFFFSTCKAAIEALRATGFKNIREFLYDPADDHDGDGVHNHVDEDFLHGMADQACAAEDKQSRQHYNDTGLGESKSPSFHPALFVCTSDEQDILLSRLRHNMCSPSLLWLTAATWSWAHQHIEQMPYILGGSQWHASMKYSDPYFETGVDVLKEVQRVFGYEADYDSVSHYAIPVLLAQHLQSVYRIFDKPDPISDFSNPERREALRRQLLAFTGDSIFGPISFDENGRNVGRGAAATQWLYRSLNASNIMEPQEKTTSELHNALISPLLQAEANMVVRAPSALACPPGSFVNRTMIPEQPSLLLSKCSFCPIDTFSSQQNFQSECSSCPDGTSTLGFSGATHCVKYQDNLLSKGVLFFGYSIMCLSWAIGLILIVWIFRHRADPIIRLAQPEYLVLILCGAILSSSSILAISFQAGTGQDTSLATRGCRAAPFLYTIGWVFQYGSLSSKTYRLMRLTSPYVSRQRMTALQSSPVIFLSLAFDLFLVFSWTLINPLEYHREVRSENLGSNNVLTIDSIGRCRSSDPDGIDAAAFLVPILCHHLILILVTNIALYLVRKVHSRYQERKYLLLASIFVLEVVVIGLPVLFAARDSIEASYVVKVAIVGVADVGVMLFIFLPKVRFQRKGLQSGIAVGESIMVDTFHKARQRESHRSGIQSSGPPKSVKLIATRSFAVNSSEITDIEQQASCEKKAAGSINIHNSLSLHEEMKREGSHSNCSMGKSCKFVDERDLIYDDHSTRLVDEIIGDNFGEDWALSVISRLTQHDEEEEASQKEPDAVEISLADNNMNRDPGRDEPSEDA